MTTQESAVGTANIDDALAKRVLAAIDADEVITFLQGLIQIPSVNPPGDVREAIDFCQRPLEAAGFHCRQERLVDEKPNLIAEFGGDTGPTLCFNAHVDVVPTGERSAWKYDPWGGEIHDRKVYGRGAGDDKASVTAQVMAGVALARSGVPLRGKLVVNEVADEEIGGPNGADYMVRAGLIRPDFVIVGEQTLNRVNVGEKGTMGCQLVVYGRAAHGALPWEGANAIEGMAEIIVALRRELWPQLATRQHPYFHPSSASVNVVTGGVKENVVPDRCQFFIDRRVVPGEVEADVHGEILAIAERVISEIPGLRVELVPNPELRRSLLTPDDHPLVQSVIAANAYLGQDTSLSGFSMASDGRFFAAEGIPTIIFGPGDPKLAHIPDEWVGVDEVIAATKTYALAGLNLLS